MKAPIAAAFVLSILLPYCIDQYAGNIRLKMACLQQIQADEPCVLNISYVKEGFAHHLYRQG
jgi:hypothetical protein